jgi:hypothetical protein
MMSAIISLVIYLLGDTWCVNAQFDYITVPNRRLVSTAIELGKRPIPSDLGS